MNPNDEIEEVYTQKQMDDTIGELKTQVVEELNKQIKILNKVQYDLIELMKRCNGRRK